MGGALGSEREAGYLGEESLRDKLIEIMESEFGLPEKLLKMGALSHRHVEKIRYAVTREDKNKMILNYILKNGKRQDLKKALSESSQTHLVNYISNNGEYRSWFGLDWPLTEREHEILNGNEEQLIDVLDTSELLPKLYSRLVINMKQRNIISSMPHDQARNEALLGMIRRLSRASYLNLIECLKESNQAHIADILKNGGALVPVHATLETDNLDETETQIVDEVKRLLQQRTDSAEQANRVLNAILNDKLNIVAVKRGQSIVIYICCWTEDEFGRVCKMIDNSEMKNFLQHLFNLLTPNLNFKVLSVNIYESDVNKAKQTFEASRARLGQPEKVNFWENDFESSSDDEAYLISQDHESQLHKMKMTIYRYYDFLVDRMFPDRVLHKKVHEELYLSGEDLIAFENIETLREKNELLINFLIDGQQEEHLFEALDYSDQKHLVNYLENDGQYIETFGGDWPITNKEILIIQSNHEAFVDLIEIDDLLGLLYQTGVINRARHEFVLSQSEPHKKNEVLLEILKRCSLNSYWQIIRCLRSSKQCHIADILETGGVMVRVDSKLNHLNHLNIKEISAHIVILINNIDNERHRVKDERILDEMLQLKLIGAKQHEDVSLYFLCNQSEEVDRLQTMDEDGRLKEFAESVFNQLKRIQEEIKVTLKWTPDIFTRSRALLQVNNFILSIRTEVQISKWTPTTVSNFIFNLIFNKN